MLEQSWPTIEAIVVRLSDPEKREVVARVSQMMSPPLSDEELSKRQRQAAEELWAKIDSYPVAHHDDGLQGSIDHDKILYGKPY